MDRIIRIVKKQTKIPMKFNCSVRLNTLDSRFWNHSYKLKCDRKRQGFQLEFQSRVPHIISTIFSSNKSIILGQIIANVWNGGVTFVFCNISVERMDSGTKVIDCFTEKVAIHFESLIQLPKLVVVEENIKYKITIDMSSNGNVQFTNYFRLKHEVELSNGALITFHGDVTPDSTNSECGCLHKLIFNEIN